MPIIFTARRVTVVEKETTEIAVSVIIYARVIGGNTPLHMSINTTATPHGVSIKMADAIFRCYLCITSKNFQTKLFFILY